MIRIAFSTLFISLFCISCGSEKNESSSETLGRDGRDCAAELKVCKKQKKGANASCTEKYNFCMDTGTSSARNEKTRECRVSGICS
jgi:hypothetical protein